MLTFGLCFSPLEFGWWNVGAWGVDEFAFMQLSTVLHGFKWGVSLVRWCLSNRGCCLVEISFNFSNSFIESFVFIE